MSSNMYRKQDVSNWNSFERLRCNKAKNHSFFCIMDSFVSIHHQFSLYNLIFMENLARGKEWKHSTLSRVCTCSLTTIVLTVSSVGLCKLVYFLLFNTELSLSIIWLARRLSKITFLVNILMIGIMSIGDRLKKMEVFYNAQYSLGLIKLFAF